MINKIIKKRFILNNNIKKINNKINLIKFSYNFSLNFYYI